MTTDDPMYVDYATVSRLPSLTLTEDGNYETSEVVHNGEEIEKLIQKYI